MVAEAPKLKEFHDKSENQDARGNYEPFAFLGNDGADQRIKENDDQDIAQITSYPAVRKQTYQHFDAEKKES